MNSETNGAHKEMIEEMKLVMEGVNKEQKKMKEKEEELKKNAVKEKDEELKKLRNEMNGKLKKVREEKEEELKKVREERNEELTMAVTYIEELKKRQNEMSETLKKMMHEEMKQMNKKREEKDEELNKVRKEMDEELNKVVKETNEELKKLRKELNERPDEERCKLIEDTNSALLRKERESNFELLEARRELVWIIKDLSGKGSMIRVKRMGEVDERPFMKVCEQRFSGEDVELECAMICSKGQAAIHDSAWSPFKRVGTGEKMKEVVDEEDDKLKNLSQEWGEDVKNAMKTALEEINEYNPCKRSPVFELWNFEKGRKATLQEGISQLKHISRSKLSKAKKPETSKTVPIFEWVCK